MNICVVSMWNNQLQSNTLQSTDCYSAYIKKSVCERKRRINNRGKNNSRKKPNKNGSKYSLLKRNWGLCVPYFFAASYIVWLLLVFLVYFSLFLRFFFVQFFPLLLLSGVIFTIWRVCCMFSIYIAGILLSVLHFVCLPIIVLSIFENAAETSQTL